MTCCHHWDIQPANGPTSEGVCRRCKEKRTFLNSVAEWGPEDRKVAAHAMYVTTTGKLRMTEAYKE